jgi:hypothetical protein
MKGIWHWTASPCPGKSHSFGGKYREMKVTVTLKKVSCGTELTVVQEGVPDVIPAEACYLG